MLAGVEMRCLDLAGKDIEQVNQTVAHVDATIQSNATLVTKPRVAVAR